MKAVVFAYHSIGVHAIKVLLARGLDIDLVVSHEDNASENIWFESVADLCQEYSLPLIRPKHATDAYTLIKAIAPDFIFSFYYRQMLPINLLKLAKYGAYNLHGSLLPKYRGRVPVNWAVLHGETETGVTLHEMVEKPDAGSIFAKTSVPILPDDTAFDVFKKLNVAAEQCLWSALPNLLQGNITPFPNPIELGSYFGGRTPEDGRIDWSQSAQAVYNLYRAIAHPYPMAFTEVSNKRLFIEKARLAKSTFCNHSNLPLGLSVVDNLIFGVCGDGCAIEISKISLNGNLLSPSELGLLIYQ